MRAGAGGGCRGAPGALCWSSDPQPQGAADSPGSPLATALGWLMSPRGGSPASPGANVCTEGTDTCAGGVWVTHACAGRRRADKEQEGPAVPPPLPAKGLVSPPRVFLAVTCVTSAAVAAGGGRGRLSLLPHAAFALRLAGSHTGGRARCRRGPAAPAQVQALGGSWGWGVRRELCGCPGSQAGPLGREGYF